MSSPYANPAAMNTEAYQDGWEMGLAMSGALQFQADPNQAAVTQLGVKFGQMFGYKDVKTALNFARGFTDSIGTGKPRQVTDGQDSAPDQAGEG